MTRSPASIPNTRTTSEKTVKDMRGAMRKQYSAEEKIRIVLDGIRGEAKPFCWKGKGSSAT